MVNFDWHFETTRIADRDFPLAVATDPDGMLIDACERQDAGETGVIDPFWAATWRAAAGLDQFIASLDLNGVRVLELGCGTGHAGIAAALRGAVVTMTDGVDDPLHLVRHSVAAIDPPPVVQRLRFGIDDLDDDPFPVILGSDVTYLRQLWPELQRCVDRHLAPGGQWLLSDPYRIIANEFRDWIGNTNRWTYQEHRIPLDDAPQHPIRVMQLTRIGDEQIPIAKVVTP